MYNVVERTKCLVVLFQKLKNTILSEDGTKGLILPLEAQSHHAIPFLRQENLDKDTREVSVRRPHDEVDGRRRIVWLDAYNGRFDLGTTRKSVF